MKRFIMVLGILLATFGVVGVVSATHVSAMGRFASSDKSVYVKSDETTDGTLYAAGESVIVEGTVNGDVFCAGTTIDIRATVKGDVFCAGRQVTVSGAVDGSVRLAGESVDLRGKIGRNATVFAGDLLIESSASIAGDLNGAGATVQLSGNVGRDVAMSSETLAIAAEVGRDVQGEYSRELTIANDAKVGGRVHVSAPTVTNDGKVAGGVQREDYSTRRADAQLFGSVFGFMVMMTFGLIVTSLVLVWLMPRFFERTVALRKNEPMWSAVAGFVTLTFLPSVAVMFSISGIGIPLGILFIVVWMLLILLSGPVVAYLVGTLLLRRRKRSGRIFTMFVGSVVLVLLYLIPLINVVAMLVTAMFGAGVVLVTLYKQKVFAR